MHVCNKCGRKFPKPFKCYCSGEKVNIQDSDIKPTQNLQQFISNIKQQGSQHWNKLHTYPATVVVWNAQEAQEWYKNWEQNIPNINCSCRKHWFELTSVMPPDFSSAEKFFEWSVAAHNKVNERLEKPIVSLEKAKEIHGF